MDTGHKSTKMPDGKTIIEWILPIIADEATRVGVEAPTNKQIALVISALRMHHIITHAANYDTSELGKPEVKTTYWPIESSIGRYFRDASREILEEGQL